MTPIEFKPDKRAIAIVAHPDDETIWMGGFLMKHPDLDWTILSLCRATDTDRAPKFARVCELYGAKSIITDLDDEDKLSIDETILIIKRFIAEKISGQEFDYLFTHGDNGEYGHPRHIGVHRAVSELFREGGIKAGAMYCFNYRKVDRDKYGTLRAKPDSDYIVMLNPGEFKKKKGIVADMYGYAWDGIDVGYCVNPEAFKLNTKP